MATCPSWTGAPGCRGAGPCSQGAGLWPQGAGPCSQGAGPCPGEPLEDEVRDVQAGAVRLSAFWATGATPRPRRQNLPLRVWTGAAVTVATVCKQWKKGTRLGLVINHGDGGGGGGGRGLQNGKIAGPKLCTPPPPQERLKLSAPPF